MVAFADDETRAAVRSVPRAPGGRAATSSGWIVRKPEESQEIPESSWSSNSDTVLRRPGGVGRRRRQIRQPGSPAVAQFPVASTPRAGQLAVRPARLKEIVLRGAAPPRTSGHWQRCTETQKMHCCCYKLKRASDFSIARSAAAEHSGCWVRRAHPCPDRVCRRQPACGAPWSGRGGVRRRPAAQRGVGLPRCGIREACQARALRRRGATHCRGYLRRLRDQNRSGSSFSGKKSRRFAYPPNLYVVDGGAPQIQRSPVR